jgi:hypothetical protein
MNRQSTLSKDKIEQYEQELSEQAAEYLDISPENEYEIPIVQHIREDFFALYPEGFEYGITMNVEAQGKNNYGLVFAEDGVEVSADHYYDTFRGALRALEKIEKD